MFSHLKQQRRRRLRKRQLKDEFRPLQTLSRLFRLVQFVKCWQIFLELNFKRLYRSSEKEKESRCLVFTSISTKRGTTAKKCTKKRYARAKLLFCQSKPIDFFPSSLTSPSSLLKLQIPIERFHMTSRRPYWCSKTINGGHVSVPNQSCGS